MTKITNKEEAVKMIEVCAIKEAEATKNGDYKTNNKYARYEAECTKYLYQHGQLQALYEYLEHENPSVRLSAAYALLPLYEEDCKKVLSELVKGNYGMCGGTQVNLFFLTKITKLKNLVQKRKTNRLLR